MTSTAGALRELTVAVRSRRLLLPLGILTVLAGAAVVGPWLWPHDPLATNLSESLLQPSAAHPMGTDASGRDVLARFLAGARISLFAGVVVAVVSGLIGTVLGVVSARSGVIVDNVLMRLLDIVLAFPQLILAMAIAIALGRGVPAAIVGAALGCIPVTARLVRSELLQISQLPFVTAAETSALPRWRIVLHHLLPHARPTLVVQSAAVFGSTIITLAALGFVGLGAQVPLPEWGSMIAEGLQYSLTGAWWIVVFPGIGLFLAVAGANILADRISAHGDAAATGNTPERGAVRGTGDVSGVMDTEDGARR
ncbi:ABC transporter permease [Leucobacter celer]|uniref:ABC transporter permease n=1 Tax=Leucobacter celer TaxID=668625 RepID=UPI0009497005|nr:ABC transporter permease [Leucobacter celer]